MKALEEALRDHDVAGLATRRASLIRDLARTRRTLAEVRQKISLWDRVVFFADTPDEAREEALERELERARAGLASADGRLSEAFDAVAKAFPPFAIARRLARCFALAHDGFEIRGVLFASVAEKADLTDALDDIGARIAETWLPDFDAEALFDALDEEDEARRVADRQRPLESDAHDGHAALTMDELAPRIARRLLDNGFFAARARWLETWAEVETLRMKHHDAAEAVPWTATLNVITKAPSELARDRAATLLREGEERLAAAYQQERALLQDALRAYPPLDLYQAMLECVGVLGLVARAKEAVVTTTGKRRQRSVVEHAALLVAGLRRLEAAFARAFPEVPNPDALLDKDAVERARPRAVDQLCDRLDGDDAAALIRKALSHAIVRGQDLARLAHVRKKISWLDRLVFWKKSASEAEAEQLQKRDAWNARWIDRLSDDLLIRAQAVGKTLGPFAVRDGALAAIQAIGAIHTDGGSSMFPKSCSVYGRGEALAALDAIRKFLDEHYHVGMDRAALLRSVYEGLDATPPGYGLDLPPCIDPLSPEEAVKRIAARLKESEFQRSYEEVAERRSERRPIEDEKRGVEQLISFWDKLNIFSKTPDERRRDELKQELRRLGAEEQRAAREVNVLFEDALAAYPPAALACDLADIIDAVSDITAVCRAYTVSTGSGKNRRTETRYRCELVGKGRAVDAMTRWAARLTQAFGALPGYREVLEEWQLRGWSVLVDDARPEEDDHISADDQGP